MRIAEDLPDFVFPDLPAVRESDRGDVLIPITNLGLLSEVDQLADGVSRLVVNHVSDDVASVADAFNYAVSELAQNGVEHGKSRSGCYIAAQRYRAGTAGAELVLSIADLGIGIPAHLRRRYGNDVGGDADAMLRATEERVSGTGNSDRGFGLPTLIEEAQAARMSHARLILRSGGATVTTVVRPDRVLKSSRDTTNKKGTWATFVLGAVAAS